MKFLHALAIAAAAFTVAPAAFSNSDLNVEASFDRCARAKKSVKKVCQTYMAHYNASYELARQLRSDRNSIKQIRAHMYAGNTLVRSIYRNRGVNVVAKNVSALEGTAKAVLEQLGPLAEEWENYAELQEKLVSTLSAFDSETNVWMKNKTGNSTVNCDKVKGKIQGVCKAYKTHTAAVQTYITRLKIDELTPKFGEAHVAAATDIYKAISGGKSKTRVKAKVKKLEETTAAVLEQIGPLAEEWENYAEMAKAILESKVAFEKALNTWMDK